MILGVILSLISPNTDNNTPAKQAAETKKRQNREKQIL